MSRHRPYLAIVDLSWSTVFEESVHGYGRIPDSIKCKIRNVGEAPAKSIHLKGRVVVVTGSGRGVGGDFGAFDEFFYERRRLGVSPGAQALLLPPPTKMRGPSISASAIRSRRAQKD